MNELEKQINLVVEARAKAREALINKTGSYQSWLNSNQHLLDSESNTKVACMAHTFFFSSYQAQPS